MSNLAPIKVIACIVQYICLTLNTPALDIVCIWVSTPLKNTTPSFLPSSPLNLQTAQAPPFKFSQFELLVMTEQDILVYKLFFVIFLTDNQVKFLMFITFFEMSKEPWCLPTKKILHCRSSKMTCKPISKITCSQRLTCLFGTWNCHFIHLQMILKHILQDTKIIASKRKLYDGFIYLNFCSSSFYCLCLIVWPFSIYIF